MSELQYAYPFDPTGSASSNRIVNERHTINPPDYSDFYFVVPLVAPFFKENLVVRHWPSGRELIDGVDFTLSYQFIGASRATANPVYGAISLYDYELTGVLELTYNTIGGQWTIDETAAAEMLANATSNPRITTWEEVVEQPASFPVIDHEWDLVDLVGGAEMVDMLNQIREAILIGGGGEDAVASHLLNFDNPHQVTKSQVGLALVGNYPLASINEGNEGTRNDRYMTPVRTKDAIDALVGSAFQAHAADIENPHQVTKAQVGLSAVMNYPTADDVEARDGTSPSRYLTPYGATLLIDEKVGAGVKDHLTNYNNPHQVSASQVGLGSVPNYPMATNLVAQAGNSVEYFMSPYHTAILINEMVSAPLSNHVGDRSNPHSVTKSQVGLGSVENFAIATELEARDATALNKYMTPYGVRLTIEELVGGSLANHPSDTTNPHNVTKSQVGLGAVQNYSMANTSEMNLGTATNRYVSPKLVSDFVAQGVAANLQGHEDRIDNPHQVTKAQIGLGSVNDYGTATEIQSRDGVRSDLYMTPQGVKWSIDSFISTSYGNLANRLGTLETVQDDHVADLNNPHNVTLAQLGAMSQTDIEARLDGKLDSTATSANSLLLEGQSVQDILTQVESDVAITYVTQEEIVILRETLSTTFEDGVWELQGGTAIRLQAGSATGVFTQTTDRIVAVDGGDNNIWHIGGTGGLVARSTDNGLTWSGVTLTTTNDISDIKYLGTGVWLVSTVAGELFRSEDDGLNWVAADLGLDPAYVILTIVSDGANRALIIGDTVFQESTDAGLTWAPQTAYTTVTGVQDAAVDVNDNLLLAGANGLYTYNATDGEVLVSAVPNTVALQHVAVDSTGHIVTVDVNGAHHRYSPVNVAWQTLEYVSQLKELKTDQYDLWAAISVDNLVHRSVDNGRFWGIVPTSPDAVELFGLGNSPVGWIVGGTGGAVYLSID